jgi:hypothetical protein
MIMYKALHDREVPAVIAIVRDDRIVFAQGYAVFLSKDLNPTTLELEDKGTR